MIGSRGFSLVFGGGNNGLMGVVARSAHAAGARVLGILPDFLRKIEIPLEPESEDLVIVPDMQIRKQKMLAAADAFVLLPGGLGTLDELLVIAAAVIGGTSLAGGSGTVLGAMLGALLMQSLQSGMVLLGIDSPLQSIVVGAVLVVAVWLDTVYRKRI